MNLHYLNTICNRLLVAILTVSFFLISQDGLAQDEEDDDEYHYIPVEEMKDVHFYLGVNFNLHRFQMPKHLFVQTVSLDGNIGELVLPLPSGLIPSFFDASFMGGRKVLFGMRTGFAGTFQPGRRIIHFGALIGYRQVMGKKSALELTLYPNLSSTFLRTGHDLPEYPIWMDPYTMFEDPKIRMEIDLLALGVNPRLSYSHLISSHLILDLGLEYQWYPDSEASLDLRDEYDYFPINPVLLNTDRATYYVSPEIKRPSQFFNQNGLIFSLSFRFL